MKIQTAAATCASRLVAAEGWLSAGVQSNWSRDGCDATRQHTQPAIRARSAARALQTSELPRRCSRCPFCSCRRSPICSIVSADHAAISRALRSSHAVRPRPQRSRARGMPQATVAASVAAGRVSCGDIVRRVFRTTVLYHGTVRKTLRGGITGPVEDLCCWP